MFFLGNWEKTPCLVEATSPSLNPGIREMGISTLTALDWMTIALTGIDTRQSSCLEHPQTFRKAPTQAMNIQRLFGETCVICFAFLKHRKDESPSSPKRANILSCALGKITNRPLTKTTQLWNQTALMNPFPTRGSPSHS